jgi:hypothetical protein
MDLKAGFCAPFTLLCQEKRPYHTLSFW